MSNKSNPLLTIARMTALEASRQPIFLLMTTSVVLLIGLLPLVITHVLGDSARIIRDSAMALQFLSGLILACLAATSTITRELRKGTLASIIAKPVSRSLFFAAKFAGVTMIMCSFAITTTLATMLATRSAAELYQLDWWGIGPLFVAIVAAYIWSGLMNYLRRVPFLSRAYATLTLGIIAAFIVSSFVKRNGEMVMPWNILPAGALMALAMVLFSIFAVSLATRLDMVPTCSICSVIFFAGLMSDYLLGAHADEHPVYRMLYTLVPNWQHFWAVDALHGDGIPWSYTLGVMAYTAMYGLAVFCTGLWAFRNMEVK